MGFLRKFVRMVVIGSLVIGLLEPCVLSEAAEAPPINAAVFRCHAFSNASQWFNVYDLVVRVPVVARSLVYAVSIRSIPVALFAGMAASVTQASSLRLYSLQRNIVELALGQFLLWIGMSLPIILMAKGKHKKHKEKHRPIVAPSAPRSSLPSRMTDQEAWAIMAPQLVPPWETPQQGHVLRAHWASVFQNFFRVPGNTERSPILLDIATGGMQALQVAHQEADRLGVDVELHGTDLAEPRTEFAEATFHRALLERLGESLLDRAAGLRGRVRWVISTHGIEYSKDLSKTLYDIFDLLEEGGEGLFILHHPDGPFVRNADLTLRQSIKFLLRLKAFDVATAFLENPNETTESAYLQVVDAIQKEQDRLERSGRSGDRMREFKIFLASLHPTFIGSALQAQILAHPRRDEPTFDGYFIAHYSNLNQRLNAYKQFFEARNILWESLVGVGQRFLTKDKIRAFFEQHGFEVLQVDKLELNMSLFGWQVHFQKKPISLNPAAHPITAAA